jgi:uncharacterized protein (TIGR03437 family)
MVAHGRVTRHFLRPPVSHGAFGRRFSYVRVMKTRYLLKSLLLLSALKVPGAAKQIVLSCFIGFSRHTMRMENTVMKTSLLLVLLVTGAGAQTAANWTYRLPLNSPQAREYHTMVYDSARGQITLFGGAYSAPDVEVGGISSLTYLALNDTWVWDGANWAQKSPLTRPPARVYHGMAYDAARSQVVVFGGTTSGFSPAAISDTWVWDGVNWAQKSPPIFPPARMGHAMAYDSVHHEVVLFGGISAGYNPTDLNDTWVWDGANWTQKFPKTSPPARSLHAMAYDSGHGQLVLFGGIVNLKSGPALGDTWVWDGANWTQKAPQASPPAQYAHALAYDSAHGQVLLSGMFTTAANITWVWEGSNWIQKTPITSPSARLRFAMAYDSAHGQAVLCGGAVFHLAPGGASGPPTLWGDTWTWDGGSIAALPTIKSVIGAGAFGGSSAAAPGSWVEIYGTNLASTTRPWAGADFSGNNAPTSLDGVLVTIGDQKAFLDYISPGQVNAQLPSTIGAGTWQLTVTTATVTSAPVNLDVNATEPELLAPASFKIGGNQYVVAQLPDGSYVLPAGAIAGVNSRPAQPGETIVIYGIGFGAVVPNLPAGQIVTQSNQLSASLLIQFGQTAAQAVYAGLAPGFVGLYQFNVVVPPVPDNNLAPFTFNLAGVAGTQTLYTAVHQ